MSNENILQRHNPKQDPTPVAFKLFRVTMSSFGEDFVVLERHASDSQHSPETQFSSTNFNCHTDSVVPDFTFLGHLDAKLKQLTDKSLINYITECERKTISNEMTETSNFTIGNMTEGEKVIKSLQSRFYSALRPDISNTRYIQRLVKCLCLPSYVYVLAFLYLERLGEKKTKGGFQFLRLTPDNMHRLVIAACYIAAKILTPSLRHISAARFSKAGGTKSADEVRHLVYAFGQLIGHDYHVTKAEFTDMLERI